MTENSNREKRQKTLKEKKKKKRGRLLVWVVEGKLRMSDWETRIERVRGKQKECGRKRETGGWNFSITAHTDNKDPDFKRL